MSHLLVFEPMLQPHYLRRIIEKACNRQFQNLIYMYLPARLPFCRFQCLINCSKTFSGYSSSSLPHLLRIDVPRRFRQFFFPDVTSFCHCQLALRSNLFLCMHYLFFSVPVKVFMYTCLKFKVRECFGELIYMKARNNLNRCKTVYR